MGVFKREKRAKRFPSNQIAWALLDGGFAKRACTVIDISPRGAKLRCSESGSIPPIFQLAVTDIKKVTSCRVVWRKGCHIGVEFIASS